MSTPKSKKPSPLIAVSSPKVALWSQCNKCSIYLNQKDMGLHSCQEVLQMKHSFIQQGTLYSFVDLTDGTVSQLLNVDDIVFMSLSAIQVCKFEIGEPVHLKDFKQEQHVCKTVWPTSSKSLLSVQVSKNVLQNELRLKSGDAIIVSHLSCSPEPLAQLCLQCAGNISQYDTSNVTTAAAAQLRSRLVHVGQSLTIVFYGVELIFTVHNVVPCSSISSQGDKLPTSSASVEYIDSELNQLSLNSQWKMKVLVFYKIVNDTKIVIANCTKGNKVSGEDGYGLDKMGGVDLIVENIVNILNITLGVTQPIKGMKKCNGILIHGVNGTGKTTLLNCVAAHMKVFKAEILVADLFSKYYGEAESRLKGMFDSALDNAPSILLIDNLDVICSAKNRSDQERRLLSCLVAQVDRLHELQASVIVLAACNNVDNIDIQLRTPGRLDQEIELPVPSRQERLAILSCLLSKVPHMLNDEQLDRVAFVTHGYVAGDLAALLSSAATTALLADKSGTSELQYENLVTALDVVKPSAMRQVLVDVPNVKWSDIGGMSEVKLKLRQSVEWPLKHPEAFSRLGIKPPRGILMFGPPGCSKTMIAKALATESKLNFISVKGPELFRKYVGESERNVREVFKRARQVSPSVIFFDELDALAGERRDGGGGSSVQERVLAQILTEMDGIVPLNNVTIVAATNRPDRIDKALLRPGRLDRLVYVPLPDADTRAAILELRLKKSPLAGDVSVEELVDATEGYSGAEIVAVCDEAALSALEHDLTAAHVSHGDFQAALQLVKPRTPPQLLRLYENYVKKS